MLAALVQLCAEPRKMLKIVPVRPIWKSAFSAAAAFRMSLRNK
jgi:hypothetical protein